MDGVVAGEGGNEGPGANRGAALKNFKACPLLARPLIYERLPPEFVQIFVEDPTNGCTDKKEKCRKLER